MPVETYASFGRKRLVTYGWDVSFDMLGNIMSRGNNICLYIGSKNRPTYPLSELTLGLEVLLKKTNFILLQCNKREQNFKIRFHWRNEDKLVR